MSGIAEILLKMGFRVSGSDLKLSSLCQRLSECGATITEGHHRDNLPPTASALVYSSAVQLDNPEVLEAKARGIPVIRRAEVLAELMRLRFGVAVAGSHGKTSTTSLIAAVLEAARLDPTVIIGGLVKSIGTGGKLGRGEILVAESDESDRSFLLLKPSLAVITNVDAEHLDAYSSLSELEQSFEQFAHSVPFYGLAIFCIDDPKVREISERFKGRKVTYGFSPDAQLRAENVEPTELGVSFDVYRGEELLFHVDLPMYGAHFALNALAAVAVGLEFSVKPAVIAEALSRFEGVGRRIELCGVANGVRVFTDYGHHPTEIRATLRALRSSFKERTGRFHVIFQPHRYTRTRDCFAQFIEAFADCDHLILTEIYSAGQKPIEGISGDTLFQAIHHGEKEFAASLDQALDRALRTVKSGDILLCLGAGSVGVLPERLLGLLSNDASMPSEKSQPAYVQ